MIGGKNLTGETAAQGITFPGQASFAIPGASKKCADCWWWKPTKAGDKRAICGKASSMIGAARARAVPAYATICKYFRETAPTEFDP
jgi:hypothetical protein